MTQTTFNNSEVQMIFDSYSPEIKRRLMDLRALIFIVASEIEGVGKLEETLKWGQPSYLTKISRSGTTIRIDQVRNNPNHYAMYVNCQTTLIETFRAMYPEFQYDGNRAMVFAIEDRLPIEATKDCIGMALTYHRRKHQKALKTSQ